MYVPHIILLLNYNTCIPLKSIVHHPFESYVYMCILVDGGVLHLLFSLLLLPVKGIMYYDDIWYFSWFLFQLFLFLFLIISCCPVKWLLKGVVHVTFICIVTAVYTVTHYLHCLTYDVAVFIINAGMRLASVYRHNFYDI